VDFSGTDAWLRTFTFAGILVGALLPAWWLLSAAGAGQIRQLVAAGGALATIPAAITAPFQDGTGLTILGLASIAGFAAVAASALVPALREQRAASPGMVAESPGGPQPRGEPAAPAASTRVASYQAVTEARPGHRPEQTVALGPRADVSEIGFLIDYSGDGHPIRLGADNRVGRDGGAEVSIEDAGASREHCRIKLENARFVLYDLGSMNGTRLVRGGRRRNVAAPVPLSDMDVIEIGDTRLVFLTVEAPGK